MASSSLTRLLLPLAMLLAAATAAQSQTPVQVPLNPPQGLPATQPTQPPRPIAPTPSRPTAPEHRAHVLFAGRTLEITADNSSLNQILREVERLTGLKVTGGVADERVYSTYGPGETSAVLTALLGGTNSNLMLIVDRNQMPTELVLTPRQGGPSPPSPNTGRDQDERDDDRDRPDTPPQLSQHIQRPPAPLPSPEPPPAPSTIQPVTASQPAANPVPTPAATTTDQSPNGVKTPQQIYDQLLKLQQQLPKPPASNNPQ